MGKAAEKLVRKGIEAQKTMEDIRSDLISNGFNTEGYDALYKTLVNELGVAEVHAPVHEEFTHPGVELNSDQPHDVSDDLREKKIIKHVQQKHIVGLVFLTLIVIMLTLWVM